MTNEQAICAARQLSEFCNKKACASCSFYKDDCTLKREPRNWGLPVVWRNADILLAEGLLASGYTDVLKLENGTTIVSENRIFGAVGAAPMQITNCFIFRDLPCGRSFSLESIVKNSKKL